MFLVLEIRLITKLKIILNSKLLYYILLFIGVIYFGFRENFNDYKSIYNEDENVFVLTVSNIKIDGNKFSLEFSGVENLVGSLYIDDLEDFNSLKEKLMYGVKVRVLGNLNLPVNNTIPNNFNYKEYLKYKGIYYTLDIEKVEIISDQVSFIYKVKNFISDRISKIDDTGYMRAFILGDKSMINENTYNAYQKIGVTHLFALSGMHVGLLSGIILFFLKKFNNVTKYLLLDIFLVLYGFIVGFPSSIKRCILFFILNSINKVFKLNISTIKVLFITIFLLVIYDYRIVYDVGFRYSISTVLGIVLSNSFVQDDNKFKSSFKLSLVAFLFSLPISLSNFYEINLLSIFYNILYVPFVSIIVYPLSIISFVCPYMGMLFKFSIWVMEQVTHFLSMIDFFNLYLDFNLFEIIIFYILLILVFYKGIKKLCFFLVLLLLVDIMIPYLDSNGYVYFFDVGQGDSSLVISPKRKDVILIDTGGVVGFEQEEWKKKNEYMESDGVITFLKSRGIKRIDLLILSHADADHAKEVENIYKEIKIDNLKINNGNIKKYEEIALNLIKGRKYTPKGMGLNYLNFKEYNDENADSVLTLLNIYNTKIISFGDATSEAEDDVIDKYDLKNINIVKLSHHGSKTSSSEAYLSRVNPDIAIISSGRNNRFNHPSKETIDTLDKLNINYLNTQTSGTIEFVIKKNGVTYNEYKP